MDRMMEDLLFLAHRIPYPPDKGDKIRSYHILKHLARGYRIHLGAFVDDGKNGRLFNASDFNGLSLAEAVKKAET